MKITLSILLLFVVLFGNCKKKEDTDPNESIVAKDNQDKVALLKTAQKISLENSISYLDPNQAGYEDTLKKSSEDITNKVGKEIQVKAMAGNYAIASILEDQLEPANPVSVDKLFFYEANKWIPIDINGKYLNMEFGDINNDLQKDLIVKGGCCSNQTLYLAILDLKVKFKVEDPNLTRSFTIFDSGEFTWEGKGTCEKFLLGITDKNPDSDELSPVQKLTFDCTGNKFLDVKAGP
jgi:hypothetical protein